MRQLAIAAMAFSALQNAFGGVIVTHLTLGVGINLVSAGLVLTLAQTSGVIGRIVWGAVADWTRRPRLAIAFLGLVMTATAIVVASFSSQWPMSLILVASAAFGASAIGWNGIFLAEVAHHAPKGHVATAIGAWSFFAFAGGLLGPSIFSVVLLVSNSFAVGYYVLATFTLGASAMFLYRGETRID
jgi:MFS family permease